MNHATDLPEFEKPPVIEVVCGMMFKPLTAILAPHLGLLWGKFQAEYPRCQEVAPLAPVVERFDETAPIQIELTDTPPLPRIWFIHANETGIVQVQRDRFLHNWKKVRADDEYPRYRTVIQMFRERLDVFEAFVREHDLGSLEPRQYELTYVNHIPQGHGWRALSDLARVFPDIAWRDKKGRFLASAEALHVRMSFILPDRSGRLHAAIRTALRRQDNLPMLLLEMTARGMPKDQSRDAMWAWFNLAHEWIVRGFTDLTGEEMHSLVWKRSQ